MADQTKFQKFAGKLPGIVGTGVGAISGVLNVFKRSPSVRAWAQDKRDEKRRLRATGLSGSELRQALRRWTNNNPRPQGSQPYNPTALGTSNQMNPNAQANIDNGTFAFGTPPPKKSGFNPLWLLVLGVPFVFPKQFKGIRKSLKI